MKTLKNECFEGERALYFAKDLIIEHSRFQNGESPLKHGVNLTVCDSTFAWKYPLWNCADVRVNNSTLELTARSGIWYTNGISMAACQIDAPKTFRMSSGIALTDCTLPNAAETLWSCSDISLKNVSAAGDYFGMGCCNVVADSLNLDGNYAFDGGRNIEIRNSRLMSKDAFWNCENVTVRDSVIIGEYLGWNSKNLRFENCLIESDQGLCYIDTLTIIGCKFERTPLAFEYCKNVNIDIIGKIDSIKNPTSGIIRADEIGEIILDDKFTNPREVEIIVKKKEG